MEVIKLLKQFTEVPGPSGYEQPIAAVVGEIWESYTDELQCGSRRQCDCRQTWPWAGTTATSSC